MPPTATPTCQTCRFFTPHNGSLGGFCHRFPPQYANSGTPNENHRWKFPWVGLHAWCGEFLASADRVPGDPVAPPPHPENYS